MHPLLDGVKAKIDRATQHLETFRRDSNVFEEGAYHTLAQPDLPAGVFRLFAKDMGLGSPPVQLMLLAGEIAYQLRSALDHIAFVFATDLPEIARKFPIFDSQEGYEKKGRAK